MALCRPAADFFEAGLVRDYAIVGLTFLPIRRWTCDESAAIEDKKKAGWPLVEANRP